MNAVNNRRRLHKENNHNKNMWLIYYSETSAPVSDIFHV